MPLESKTANHKGRLFQGASIDTDDTQVVIQLLVGNKTHAMILPIDADILDITQNIWDTVIDMNKQSLAENIERLN